MTQTNHMLEVLAQGERLNLAAAIALSDVNASHLIVHSVLARAMGGQVCSATLSELDADLAYALDLHARKATGARA
jgi:hypothetical protein